MGMSKRVKKPKQEAELIEPETLSDDIRYPEPEPEVVAMRRALEKLAGPSGDNIFGRDEKDIFRLCFLNNQSVEMVAKLTGEPIHYVKRVKKQVATILGKTYLEEIENV